MTAPQTLCDGAFMLAAILACGTLRASLQNYVSTARDLARQLEEL